MSTHCLSSVQLVLVRAPDENNPKVLCLSITSKVHELNLLKRWINLHLLCTHRLCLLSTGAVVVICHHYTHTFLCHFTQNQLGFESVNLTVEEGQVPLERWDNQRLPEKAWMPPVGGDIILSDTRDGITKEYPRRSECHQQAEHRVFSDISCTAWLYEIFISYPHVIKRMVG